MPGTFKSWNRYAYVANNPVNAVDPDGELGFLATALVGGLFDAGMQVISNALEGKSGADLLEGTGSAFVQGAVIGATGYGLAKLGARAFKMGRRVRQVQEASAAGKGARAADDLCELAFDYNKHPDLAENIWNAQRAGHPDVLTHGGNRAANRAAALKDVPDINPLSRDEYPFASAMEGGPGSWVGHVPKAQQNSQGAMIKNFLKKHGIGAGDRYRVTVVNYPGGG